MSYLPCITNSVPDVRSCTLRGQHASNCDGWEWRYNRDAECEYPTPVECSGCLPVPADHGLLCWHCWEKLLAALKIAPDMITHLCSVDRAQQVDNNGVRASATWILPVPMTWRTADDLIMLLGHPDPGFPADATVWEAEAITDRYVDYSDPDNFVRRDPQLWTSSIDGAENAVRFYLLIQRAMKQHPMADYEHKVQNVRCRECFQLTLLWKPPLTFEDGIHIVCSNPACTFEVDETQYQKIAAQQLEVLTSAIRERKAAELAEARKARALDKRARAAKAKAAEKAAEVGVPA
ncbi:MULTISPECIES: hypothetical protein [unclassified Cryobacterium]|uniref:hypothetical protein n=1 Tax=unclassified Cryobacterium TaxID=2649013 RepID=UPI002AB5AE66|nr:MULTISPECIES: hypothetical protein [unclassified Cryobacterium]MDY7542619.1 hypothetical protein [Cryobacterium sp. 5B3]MEB0264739.1 hypothetical protein [Cryobacterium sp. 10I5]MEB0273711.1 hypothetical protein [Cryobacterium sp. 5B3]